MANCTCCCGNACALSCRAIQQAGLRSQGASSRPLATPACQDPSHEAHPLKAEQQSRLRGGEIYGLLVSCVEERLPSSGAPPHQPMGARKRHCWRAHETLLSEVLAQRRRLPCLASRLRTGGGDTRLNAKAAPSVYLTEAAMQAPCTPTPATADTRQANEEGSCRLRGRCAAVACARLGDPPPVPSPSRLHCARTGGHGRSAGLYCARGAAQWCPGARLPAASSWPFPLKLAQLRPPPSGLRVAQAQARA